MCCTILWLSHSVSFSVKLRSNAWAGLHILIARKTAFQDTRTHRIQFYPEFDIKNDLLVERDKHPRTPPRRFLRANWGVNWMIAGRALAVNSALLISVQQILCWEMYKWALQAWRYLMTRNSSNSFEIIRTHKWHNHQHSFYKKTKPIMFCFHLVHELKSCQ